MSADTTFPKSNDSSSPSIIKSPNPAWKLGDGLSRTPLGEQWTEDGRQGWKSWDMTTTPPRDAYNLLKSAVVPRPLALVSSLSTADEPNLAIFSFFNVVSSTPPILSISFTPGRGPRKDTTENILAMREFVVNLVSEPFVEAANACATSAPRDVDEWKLAGLTMEPSVSVRPARVQESAASFECELHSYQHIYTDDDPTTPSVTLLLGRVRHAHVRKAVLQADGLQVDPIKSKVMSRIGGTGYATLGDLSDLKVRGWDDVKRELGGEAKEKRQT